MPFLAREWLTHVNGRIQTAASSSSSSSSSALDLELGAESVYALCNIFQNAPSAAYKRMSGAAGVVLPQLLTTLDKLTDEPMARQFRDRVTTLIDSLKQYQPPANGGGDVTSVKQSANSNHLVTARKLQERFAAHNHPQSAAAINSNTPSPVPLWLNSDLLLDAEVRVSLKYTHSHVRTQVELVFKYFLSLSLSLSPHHLY